MNLMRIPSTVQASAARREGAGTVRGLVSGLLFALGIWLALTGLVLIVLR